MNSVMSSHSNIRSRSAISIRTAFLLAFLFLATGYLAHAEAPPGYKLVWSDEFNGTALDTSQWEYRLDAAFFSKQKAENVSVQDGQLRIMLKAEKAGNMNHTGGGVISRRQFLYGYYEARVKVPATRGWHTSFWTSATTDDPNRLAGVGPHELDILEQDSLTPNVARRCLWMRYKKSTNNPEKLKDVAKEYSTPNLASEFHTWGAEFTPTTIRYFFDGQEIASWDVSNYKHGLQRILLSCISQRHGTPLNAVGPVDAELPAYAEFDYVRFYEKNN